MAVPVIVEIGVNHVGNADYANEYITKLIEAKVYAATFQVHSPFTTSTDEKECETIKKRLLPDEFYKEAIARLKTAGIQVGIASTDYQSIAHFASMGIDFFKTLGADITCQPIFEAIAETGLPVYISTAYATKGEIEAALSYFSNRNVVTLIYTDGIAGALGSTNLRTIDYFREAFAIRAGYGKHSVGDDMLIASLAFKPSVIFIYVKGDRQLAHPDDNHAVPWHQVSKLLSRISVVEQALARQGQETLLTFDQPEKAMRQRRRLIAWTAIKAGEAFSRKNLAAVRPSGEVSASEFDRLLGRKARKSYKKGDSITPEELNRNKT
jgi:sialic acid synthase SpsE